MTEYLKPIISGVAEAITFLIKQKFSDLRGTVVLRSTKHDIEQALSRHWNFVCEWSEVVETNFDRHKRLSDLYVPLTLCTDPLAIAPTHDGRIFARLAGDSSRRIIFGGPGAGKTTSLKFLVHSLASEAATGRQHRVPILIRMRNMKPPVDLLSFIADTMDIHFEIRDDKKKEVPDSQASVLIQHTSKAFMREWIRNAPIMLLVDGLDEFDPDALAGVLQELEYLASCSPRMPIVATCRTGELKAPPIGFDPLYMAALNEEQITELSNKWFGNLGEAAEMRAQLREVPYRDTLSTPLHLANLCLVYSRYSRLPDRPSETYETVVSLRLEDWDRSRQLPQRRSRYARGLSPSRKRDFLAALAFDLVKDVYQSAFSRKDVRASYLRVYSRFGLDKDEASQVIDEIETHTGLLSQTSFVTVEFCHKSIQEYLTAYFISRRQLSSDDVRRMLRMPNEAAIACSISSSAGEIFSQLVSQFLTNCAGKNSKEEAAPFWVPFSSRFRAEGCQLEADLKTCWHVLAICDYFYRCHNLHPEIVAFVNYLLSLETTRLAVFALRSCVKERRSNRRGTITLSSTATSGMSRDWISGATVTVPLEKWLQLQAIGVPRPIDA